MNISNFNQAKKSVSKSKESTFTVITNGSINIHETKDFEYLFASYESKIKTIDSIKTGSHYGFN